MPLQNRDGTAVSAVPFVVTGGSVFLLLYSFIPPYLQTFGLPLAEALLATTGAYAVALAGAYYRQVYRAEPERRDVIPAGLRFRRLVYLMLITAAVAVLLALPLVAR
jgi:hypothetical protein